MNEVSAADRSAIAAAAPLVPCPAVSIVTPTYNECANLKPLVHSIARALEGVAWELIVVDDDSPDGTYAAAVAMAAEGYPVRGVRRVGRRGLASAVVEGVLVARADLVGVMDADLQHDEQLLPRMIARLSDPAIDVVIASRHIEGGSLGDWGAGRQRMSALATWASRMLIGDSVSDPMSGFFMTRRAVFEAAVYDMSQQGYKILLDLLTSSRCPLRVAELPYVFRLRQDGESKVDVMILAEFAFLLIEKLTRGLVPPKFVLFVGVGGVGLVLHLTVLRLSLALGANFLAAQAIATMAAMTFNYVANNAFTYRANRLAGADFVVGYFLFCIVCSFGVVANVSVADLTMQHEGSWFLAGAAGAVMSAVFNFEVATRYVWGRRRRLFRPARAAR